MFCVGPLRRGEGGGGLRNLARENEREISPPRAAAGIKTIKVRRRECGECVPDEGLIRPGWGRPSSGRAPRPDRKLKELFPEGADKARGGTCKHASPCSPVVRTSLERA